MNEVLNCWQKIVGYHTEIGKELGLLRLASISRGDVVLDLRQLASTWNDWYREYRDHLNLDKSSGVRKQKKTLDKIKETPPEHIDAFIRRFSHIEAMEGIDPRTIAMIAGIPRFLEN